jgi:hypothetical protein
MAEASCKHLGASLLCPQPGQVLFSVARILLPWMNTARLFKGDVVIPRSETNHKLEQGEIAFRR